MEANARPRTAATISFVLILVCCILLFWHNPVKVGANGVYCCPYGYYDQYGVYHPGTIECYYVDMGYVTCAPNPDPHVSSEKEAGTVVAQEVVRTTSKEVGRLLSTRIANIVSSRALSADNTAHGTTSETILRRTSVFGPDESSRTLTATHERVSVDFTEVLSTIRTGDFQLQDFHFNGSSLAIDASKSFTGLASGDSRSQPKSGFWASGSWSGLRNKLSSTAFKGDLYLLMSGFDHMVRDNVLLGVALGYEKLDIDTPFNQGALEGSGFTFAPYGALILGKGFSLDLMGSYTRIDYDSSRNFGSVSSSYNAKRIMAGGSINYNHSFNDWNLGARLAFLLSSEMAGNFLESDGTQVGSRSTHLGEFRFGGRFGRTIGKWEPSLSLYYVYDAIMEKVRVGVDQEQPSNDRDELEATLGINYYGTERTMFSLDLSHVFLRKDFRNTSLLLNFRFEF